MSDPNELLERQLTRVIDRRDATGVHFFCQIGGRDDSLGMTTLQISGSGWTILGWRRGDERKFYNYQLDWEILEHFYTLVRRYPFWEASPTTRKAQGDETNLHFKLSFRDEAMFDAIHFWQNDMHDYPVLKYLTKHLISLIEALSDDEIPTLSVEKRAS